jgi:tyrosyl-tRNA synthetase
MSFSSRSHFIRESQERGFLFQASHLEQLDAFMDKSSITGYIGFDATASSLHVGNLLQIMWLRLLQRCGHKPLVIMGDGTTRIGDPSGKDTQRQMLSPEQIDANIKGIQKVFEKFLKFGDGPTDAKIIRNGEWLFGLNYIDFLRDYGRHFSVNRMLSFDSVKQRLDREQPLSFLEFNYMIFQAYDFLELRRRYNCQLQFGGSDQWGNIINGIELIRRVDQKDAFGLTAALVTTSDGSKMGKTASGAIWLNEEMLSAYDYWQFWRNTSDADVGKFLRIYTDIPMDEIRELENLKGSEINHAKERLADEATRMCHGDEAWEKVKISAQNLFTSGNGVSLEKLKDSLPHLDVNRESIESGYAIVDALVAIGLCESKGEAKRLIKGGGARVNNNVVSDEAAKITLDDINKDGFVTLMAGKKRHGLVFVS